MLQSLFRPVLRPIMMGVMSVTGSRRAWSPLSLWPDGIDSPGMWISPRTLTSEWQDYTGTTPVSVPGTVADTSNPVGLALDIRAGATVLTDPGNHMLQSTSAARPLLSARRNLLTYTEDFSNAVWEKNSVTVTANSTTAPDGALTADTLSPASAGSSRILRYTTNQSVSTPYVYTVRVKKGAANWVLLVNNGIPGGAWFNVDTGTVGTVQSGVTAEIAEDANGFFACVIKGNTASSIPYNFVDVYVVDADNSTAVSAEANIYIWGAQLELGTTVTPYQSVPGDGSTYATDFPIFQKYDGVDDGMATAAFTAGTLTSAMDCMIPVRRDSAALPQVIGLYQSDQTKYFGVVGTVSSDGAATYSGCGTPTVFVDGVEVASTRGALFDVLTIGDFHILEYRGLDLSAWVNANFGNYGVPYQVNGARGDIMLFESTASTADKDAARQYLADYYGVTLP
mgnify:CR=1 FL=1